MTQALAALVQSVRFQISCLSCLIYYFQLGSDPPPISALVNMSASLGGLRNEISSWSELEWPTCPSLPRTDPVLTPEILYPEKLLKLPGRVSQLVNPGEAFLSHLREYEQVQPTGSEMIQHLVSGSLGTFHFVWICRSWFHLTQEAGGHGVHMHPSCFPSPQNKDLATWSWWVIETASNSSWGLTVLPQNNKKFKLYHLSKSTMGQEFC